MSTALDRLGRFAARRPWRVIGTWLVLAIVVVASASTFGKDLDDPFGAPGLDSHRAQQLLERAGAETAGVTAQIVATPGDGGSFRASAPARADLARTQRELGLLPHVVAVGDPAGALANGPAAAAGSGTVSAAAAGSGTVSADGRIALIRVQYEPLGELEPADLAALKTTLSGLADDTSLRIEAGGELFFAFEEPPAGVAEAIGLAAALVILLLAFGSFVAAGLPIATALVGLALGAGSLTLVAHLIDVPAWAPMLGSMVGIGVGIDYALFVLTRYRENLGAGHTVEDAVGEALAKAGTAVVFAGGTVVVAILGLAFARIPFVTSGGIAIALVVLVMVLASITLLPALLGLARHRVNGRRRATPRTSGRSAVRWSRHVTRHPAAYAVTGTVVLLALAAPVLGLRLGFPDQGVNPESRTERRAYDLVAEGFGPGANGPLVVAVDLRGDAAVVEPLTAAVTADRGVAGVSPASVDRGTGVASFVVQPTTAPQDEATRATVERLRDEVFPAALDGSSESAHVGGQVATFMDLGERVQERLPWFVAAVVLLSFVLLLVLFRSVLVPVKAALLNLLSVGAAYGVLVMVFQWGWGAALIGLESTVPIVSFIPLFMFAILFGLSMDYEVFLLSRIREEWLRTGDNTGSVVTGLARTARTITSAALIMIAVFGAFALGDDPVTKMFGLGLATAILVDATVVRMVLVPATMTLLGAANWWLPAWLDRALPGAATQPAPARVAESVEVPA